MATPDPWRPVRVSTWTWLEDLDPLAQRLWFWLATGPDSTQTGLVLLREYRACGALRTNPKALRAAVRALGHAGRLAVGDARGSAVPLYLRGWWAAQCGRKSADHPPMRAECAAFVDASLGSQACEEFDLWVSGCGQPATQAGRRLGSASIQQEQEQEKEQKQEINLPSVGAPQASQEALPLTCTEERVTKSPPSGLLLVSLWNDEACPQRATARLEARNIRLCNAIVDRERETLLRWYFSHAARHPYWSGNGRSVPRFSRILSAEGWDAFTKDIDKFAGVATVMEYAR